MIPCYSCGNETTDDRSNSEPNKARDCFLTDVRGSPPPSPTISRIEGAGVLQPPAPVFFLDRFLSFLSRTAAL